MDTYSKVQKWFNENTYFYVSRVISMLLLDFFFIEILQHFTNSAKGNNGLNSIQYWWNKNYWLNRLLSPCISLDSQMIGKLPGANLGEGRERREILVS